jgi:hypothetical protein
MKEYKIYTKNNKSGLTEAFTLHAIDISMICDLIKIVNQGLNNNTEIVLIEKI